MQRPADQLDATSGEECTQMACRTGMEWGRWLTQADFASNGRWLRPLAASIPFRMGA
jgi:hypothetical protein